MVTIPVSFVGGTSYTTNPAAGTVLINAPEVINNTTGTTGSLKDELWFTSAPYTGGEITGYVAATIPYNTVLGPNQYFAPVSINEPFTPPPSGYDYATLAVEEYDGATSTYVIESYENYTSDVVTITAASLNIALTNPAIGEAYRLYQSALNRAPDQAGLTYWTNALLNGVGPLTVAQDFMNSAEFQADYGNLSVSDFVSTLYNNVLHRAPDSGGDSYWINALNSGQSKASVLLSFSDSAENRANTAIATHT